MVTERGRGVVRCFQDEKTKMQKILPFYEQNMSRYFLPLLKGEYKFLTWFEKCPFKMLNANSRGKT